MTVTTRSADPGKGAAPARFVGALQVMRLSLLLRYAVAIAADGCFALALYWTTVGGLGVNVAFSEPIMRLLAVGGFLSLIYFIAARIES